MLTQRLGFRQGTDDNDNANPDERLRYMRNDGNVGIGTVDTHCTTVRHRKQSKGITTAPLGKWMYLTVRPMRLTSTISGYANAAMNYSSVYLKILTVGGTDKDWGGIVVSEKTTPDAYIHNVWDNPKTCTTVKVEHPAGGDVGIGTTNPNKLWKLDVRGFRIYSIVVAFSSTSRPGRMPRISIARGFWL